MKTIAVAALVMFLSASFSQAETSIADLSHSELINVCIEALDRSENAEIYAEELAQRSRFHLGAQNRAKGKRCLEETYQTEFVFEGGRFHSPDLAAALERRAQLLKEQQQERERDYTEALAQACIREFDIDRFRALTTPVCGAVFKAIGLPENN
ncbi:MULTISPECIES: hypothetical protein [unclassified Sulfitobacter]|uniref:hypothetical protein n=1 Tax=unclassified Sulfitobacter TaxID=196795 RepID=UPI0023E2CF0D|nr:MULTISPECIES: hypothetical protein [unclassified Sulfitobacter]MDF3383339.1 hypothetical protein [Sulfitobacter sp. Ks11]MDF3386758.1 hypothetical protein [Sulfitobacter sp. M85]MDF3390177.1 hypothetical protein [Sulfitobacter sp. Ks16]MDF3400814.1 hypothetical protein [Sulfitobacter sp. KE39]MDF3404235.1 hypothetical protein [Sulfitobacter sp. Ks35]